MQTMPEGNGSSCFGGTLGFVFTFLLESKIEKATNRELNSLLKSHLDETESQIARLEKVRLPGWNRRLSSRG